MKRNTKATVFLFFAVCGMGLFSALAAGLQWGTHDAGVVSSLTLLLASLVALMCFINFPEE